MPFSADPPDSWLPAAGQSSGLTPLAKRQRDDDAAAARALQIFAIFMLGLLAPVTTLRFFA